MNAIGPRILIIRFGSLGDLVLLTALVEGIALSFPGCEIHLATKRRYAGLFSDNPLVNRIHELEDGAGPAQLLRLRRTLSDARFDVIVDAHNVIRSNLLYWSLRAERKVRLGKDHIRKISLISAGRDLYGDPRPMKDRYLELIGALGAPVPDVPTRLVPAPRARRKAEELLGESALAGRRIVAIAPGARWETKRWPAGNFSELAGALAAEGYGLLIVGGDSDRGYCRSARAAENCVDACGRLSLMETAAALERAEVLITNDSAPLHMAEAVGTPVVALFGPTVRQFGYFPLLGRSIAMERDLECRPCSRNGSRPCRLESRDCLDTIKPSEVLRSVHLVLESAGEER